MKNLSKINLGCGEDYKTSWVNVDKTSKADVNWDLNKFPYPFKANQFKEIELCRILEHLSEPDKVMKEVHRIAKKNAIVRIRVPHFSSIHAWGDIEHKRPYSIRTFKHPNIKENFRVIEQQIETNILISPIALLFPIFYEKRLAYIFPASDIIIELEVKK